MRQFIDISNYEGITDIQGNKCVMDGKIYDALYSRYRQYAASIPGDYLRSGKPCILFSVDLKRRMYSYEDGIPSPRYKNVMYMNELETVYLSGIKVPAYKGGGYRRFIK